MCAFIPVVWEPHVPQVFVNILVEQIGGNPVRKPGTSISLLYSLCVHATSLWAISTFSYSSEFFYILSLDLWGFYWEPVIVILRIYHNVFVYCSSATHKIIPQKSAFVDCFYRFLRIFVEYLCLGGKIMPHMLHSSHELSYMWKFWKVFRTYIFYDKIWILLRHLSVPKIV